MKTEIVVEAKALLGEGPAWDMKTQTLYWVDILEKRVHANEGILTQLDDFVGCLAPRRNGHLLLGMRSSFADLDPASGRLTTLASLEESPHNRMNDGKCDPAGRFVAGSMDMDEKEPSGSLYSFDGTNIRRLLDGIRISNGLAWSPDHKTLYYIDTPTREVRAFDYDLSNGQIANPRTAVTIPDGLGWPDGMTADSTGNLWIAMWGGAQITRWDPRSGQLLDKIPLPALQTTACIFGGRDMNELYVTSARVGMSQADLNKYPLSGSLFKVTTAESGMPTFEFNP